MTDKISPSRNVWGFFLSKIFYDSNYDSRV